jgi:hypothetical protein
LAVSVKWSGRWEVQRERFAARQAQDARKAERARHDAALADFLRDAGPNIDKLHPKLVAPVEEQAAREELDKFQFWRVGEKRKAIMAGVVAQLNEFKTAADGLVAQSTGPATGIEEFDEYRARVRDFAEARSKSLALLLAQLNSPAAPDKAAWAEWNASRLAAGALWRTLGRP